MPRIKRKQLDINLSENDGNFGSINSPNLSGTDTLENAFDKVTFVLDKLIPPKPPFLSNLNVTILPVTSYYNGYIVGTNTLVNNILGTTTPQFETPSNPLYYFYDGNAGNISIVGLPSPLINLTTANNTNATSTGNGINLLILGDIDYYAGQAGKESFWNAIRTRISFVTPLTPSENQYSYTLQHKNDDNTISGNKSFSFYIENNNLPVISSFGLNTPQYSYVSNKKISGVPVFDSANSNDYISVIFNMSNVSKNFYLAQPITTTTTNSDLTSSTFTWSSPPNKNDVQNGVVLNFRPVSNRFRDRLGNISLSGGKLNISVTISDVLTQTATQSLSTAQQDLLRIDTISVESNTRLLQNFSSFNSGNITSNSKLLTTVYDTNEVIVGNANTRYNSELQLEGGRYIYPSKNYSTYLPVNTIDYTGQTNMRWLTFKVGNVNSVSQFRLSFPGLTQLLETSNFKVYVMLGNADTNTWQTGWMNAGVSYTGTAQEQSNLLNKIDNASCLDTGTLSSTTASNRLITPLPSGTTPASNIDVFVMIGWNNVANLFMTGIPRILSTVGGTFTNY